MSEYTLLVAEFGKVWKCAGTFTADEGMQVLMDVGDLPDNCIMVPAAIAEPFPQAVMFDQPIHWIGMLKMYVILKDDLNFRFKYVVREFYQPTNNMVGKHIVEKRMHKDSITHRWVWVHAGIEVEL